MYQNIQLKLRTILLKMHYTAKSGHIGSSLSCIDLLYSVFKIKQDEEVCILSKGHAASAFYTILYFFKKLSINDIETYYKNGTKLSAHPSALSFKEIPFALGSLGHGLPISCGIAHGNKILNKKLRTFVIMSDGETNEGTTWEAAHYAVANKLSNLIVIIDKNRLQGFGKNDDILGDTSSLFKWEAIGFEVFEFDGHDIDSHLNLINRLNHNIEKPKLLIANTIKGKGVDFMENKLEWHYLSMSAEIYEKALFSINSKYNA